MMYRLFTLLPLFLLTCCVKFPEVKTAPAPVSVVDIALSATVALVDDETSQIFCGGVMHRGLIFTAAHCVDDENKKFNIALIDEWRGSVRKSYAASVLHLDAANDLAVVRADAAQAGAGRPLSPEAPGWGERVIVIGHPRGLQWSMSDGVVSHPHRVGGPSPTAVWMQISAPVFYGNSGGPVFNTYGEIVGIVSFFADTPHLGGAVHLSVLKKAADQLIKE